MKHSLDLSWSSSVKWLKKSLIKFPIKQIRVTNSHPLFIARPLVYNAVNIAGQLMNLMHHRMDIPASNQNLQLLLLLTGRFIGQKEKGDWTAMLKDLI